MDTDHRPEDGVEGDRGRGSEQPLQREGHGGQHDGDARRQRAGTHDPAHVARRRRRNPGTVPSGEGGHDRHVDRVVAERSEAAVGEDERLNDDDDRDHQRPDPGAEQDRLQAPPSRWPVVPEATGKFTIWAAKMNAAHTPASGTRRSPNSTHWHAMPCPTRSLQRSPWRQHRRVEESIGGMHSYDQRRHLLRAHQPEQRMSVVRPTATRSQ